MRADKHKRKITGKHVGFGLLFLVAECIRIGMIVGVFFLVSYGVNEAVNIYQALGKLEKAPEESRFAEVEDKETKEPPKWTGKERVNILFLGGDARGLEENQIARSDSMLVASIDPVTKKAHLISLLRDTYVPIPGHGKGRINTAITLGGAKLAMQTAGDLLGLDIQYYVYAEFEGFKALVDAMGGIEFEVEKNMRYTDNADGNRYDIDLKKGLQMLDGDKALQYVRFRHDALSDFTRTERQRNFMMAVAKELQSTGNLLRISSIVESITPFIETNMSVSDMLKLSQLGLGMTIAGSIQAPPMELVYDQRVGGAAVIGIRSEKQLIEYVAQALEGDPNQSDTATAEGNSDGDSAANDDARQSQTAEETSASGQ